MCSSSVINEEGLFGLLFYCECGINQYAGQKTLTDVSGASLLLLELRCFRNIVLPYRLRKHLHVFMKRKHPVSEIIFLVFCSVHYIKKVQFKY